MTCQLGCIHWMPCANDEFFANDALVEFDTMACHCFFSAALQPLGYLLSSVLTRVLVRLATCLSTWSLPRRWHMAKPTPTGTTRGRPVDDSTPTRNDPIYFSTCLSTHLHQTTCLSVVYLFISTYLPTYGSTYLGIYLSLFTYWSTYLWIYLLMDLRTYGSTYVYLLMDLPTYGSAYLRIYLSPYLYRLNYRSTYLWIYSSLLPYFCIYLST